MFSDHIARALAHERQQDLVPGLRALERERSTFGIENGERARAVSPESKPGGRVRARFRRGRTDEATGLTHAREPAG